MFNWKLAFTDVLRESSLTIQITLRLGRPVANCDAAVIRSELGIAPRTRNRLVMGQFNTVLFLQ